MPPSYKSPLQIKNKIQEPDGKMNGSREAAPTDVKPDPVVPPANPVTQVDFQTLPFYPADCFSAASGRFQIRSHKYSKSRHLLNLQSVTLRALDAKLRPYLLLLLLM